MKLKEKIMYVVLSICSIFLPFTSIKKNRILFVSLESDQLSGDFKLIHDCLQEENKYEVKCLLTKFEKNIWGNIKYFFTCIRQLFAINTSGLVLLDYNNYVVSKFKRKGVKVLQLWHASGAIKKFGNAIHRDYKIDNYDVVIANADVFKDSFAQGFGVCNDQVVVTGIPNTDCLYDTHFINEGKGLMLEKYPQLQNKKVVLYAPTFRGRLMSGFKDCYLDPSTLQIILGDEYVVIYKMHPLLGEYVLNTNENVICGNKESLYQLFSVSDYLISDYSALIFDFSIFHKPMVFYTPDFEEYTRDTGLFVEYHKEMPGPICTTVEEVANVIVKNDFDIEAIQYFDKKYHGYDDGKSLERVMALIYSLMEE